MPGSLLGALFWPTFGPGSSPFVGVVCRPRRPAHLLLPLLLAGLALLRLFGTLLLLRLLLLLANLFLLPLGLLMHGALLVQRLFALPTLLGLFGALLLLRLLLSLLLNLLLACQFLLFLRLLLTHGALLAECLFVLPVLRLLGTLLLLRPLGLLHRIAFGRGAGLRVHSRGTAVFLRLIAQGPLPLRLVGLPAQCVLLLTFLVALQLLLLAWYPLSGVDGAAVGGGRREPTRPGGWRLCTQHTGGEAAGPACAPRPGHCAQRCQAGCPVVRRAGPPGAARPRVLRPAGCPG